MCEVVYVSVSMYERSLIIGKITKIILLLKETSRSAFQKQNIDIKVRCHNSTVILLPYYDFVSNVHLTMHGIPGPHRQLFCNNDGIYFYSFLKVVAKGGWKHVCNLNRL